MEGDLGSIMDQEGDDNVREGKRKGRNVQILSADLYKRKLKCVAHWNATRYFV
jgi:hypothetical protein